MSKLLSWIFALILGSIVFSVSGSDLVNERIIARKSELEAHWGVDCSELSLRLVTALNTGISGSECPIGGVLRQQLQLCAFIYQPPGATTDHHCPDYQALLHTMSNSDAEAGCPDLAIFLPPDAHCSSPPPGK